MLLKNDELLHEFYSKYGEKYPDLNLEQFKEIVFTPWLYTKRGMEDGSLDTIRLKYFGTFQVYKGRAERMIKSLDERFKYNKIGLKQYTRLKDMLEKFLKKKENEI